MREIKFRGFHPAIDENDGEESIVINGKAVIGRWAYGDLVHRSYNDTVVVDYDEIIPETLGQFTGMHDKNGKEIYEGDAVSGYVMGSYRNGWEVQWYDRTAQFVLHGNGITYGMDDLYPEKLEIIGNIHEAKE